MARETTAVQKDMGRRMREIRSAKGLTQEAFAERLGMLAPNYARIEQGRMNVTIDTIVRISNALGVAVIELFKRPRTRAVRPGRPRKA